MAKRIGTIQVDLDGLWTTLAYYGHDADADPDPVITTSIPRFLELFQEYGMKATFFAIGKDAEIPTKRKLLQRIIKEGHEVANHTYSHPFGFRSLGEEQRKEEIKRGAEAIFKATGKKPVGFKAPGYDVDGPTLGMLAQEGYLYDSSMIGTFAYPLIMAATSLISGGVRRTHGPKWSWAFAPNTLYQPSFEKEWRTERMDVEERMNTEEKMKAEREGAERKGGEQENSLNPSLLELPSSVMPVLRIPFHATFALKLGYPYFLAAYHLVKMRKIPLTYEFHATDLCDDINDPRLFHLKTPVEKRLAVVRKILQKISADYSIIPSQELVQRWQRQDGNDKVAAARW